MSTNLPPIEARIAAQERIQTILNARIEELGIDMQASFRELATYHEQLDARLDRIEANMATKDDIAGLATKDDIVETKADMAAMEERILSAFNQLLTKLDPLLSSSEKKHKG